MATSTSPGITPPARPGPADAAQGQLGARPATPTASGCAADPGTHRLGLGDGRDGWIHVPAGHRPGRPTPLVVLLHGAGGEADHALSLLKLQADRYGLLLLAPASRGQTWDVIQQRSYGPDVTRLDQALAQIFERYAIDPARLAIGGFSDGASYALSIGLINGDLFTDIIAFSPGFMAPTRREGRPRVFISHGVQDAVLPIEHCSRRLVPRLRADGYPLDYHEFADGHTVPAAMRDAAVAWFLAPRG